MTASEDELKLSEEGATFDSAIGHIGLPNQTSHIMGGLCLEKR